MLNSSVEKSNSFECLWSNPQRILKDYQILEDRIHLLALRTLDYINKQGIGSTDQAYAVAPSLLTNEYFVADPKREKIGSYIYDPQTLNSRPMLEMPRYEVEYKFTYYVYFSPKITFIRFKNDGFQEIVNILVSNVAEESYRVSYIYLKNGIINTICDIATEI